MVDQSFIHANHIQPSWALESSQPPKSFTLLAPPKSDIYVSPGPPQSFTYTAPAVCKRINKYVFFRTRVTVAAKWTQQFDQGGLIFIIPRHGNLNPDAASANAFSTHPSWIKVGIEINDGLPCTSIVARSKDGWCDWSLVPLIKTELGEETSVTVELTRFKNALMVWVVDGEARILIRKIPWVFLDDSELSNDALVGVYAAQPDPNDKALDKDLEVRFSDFCLEIK